MLRQITKTNKHKSIKTLRRKLSINKTYLLKEFNDIQYNNQCDDKFDIYCDDKSDDDSIEEEKSDDDDIWVGDKTYHDDESFNSSKAYDDREEELIDFLSKSEMNTYLTSILGGDRKAGFIKTLYVRFIRFCLWTYGTKHNCLLPVELIFEWFIDVMLIDYMFLKEYCVNNLEKLCTPSTILNHLSDISNVGKWITTYTTLLSQRDNSVSTQKFYDLIEHICRQYRKKKRNQNIDNKSLENLIRQGKAPSGGLKQLKCLLDQFHQWALNLTVDNKADHKRFLGYIAASMYVLAPQGRIQAIDNLTLNDGYLMINEGKVLSTEFKTSATYVYQPVLLPVSLTPILIKYINTIRKSNSNRLWVNYSGLPVKTMGRFLTGI